MLIGCEQSISPKSDASINQIYLQNKNLYAEIIDAITKSSNVPRHIHIAKYRSHIEITPKFVGWDPIERYISERMKNVDIITSSLGGGERDFYFTIQTHGIVTSGGFIKGLFYTPNGSSINTLRNLDFNINTYHDLNKGENYFTRIDQNWFIFFRFN